MIFIRRRARIEGDTPCVPPDGSSVFTRKAELEMIHRLLVVAAGVVCELQLDGKVSVIPDILQRLNHSGIVGDAAAGGDVVSGDGIAVFAVNIENTFASQHVDVHSGSMCCMIRWFVSS